MWHEGRAVRGVGTELEGADAETEIVLARAGEGTSAADEDPCAPYRIFARRPRHAGGEDDEPYGPTAPRRAELLDHGGADPRTIDRARGAQPLFPRARVPAPSSRGHGSAGRFHPPPKSPPGVGAARTSRATTTSGLMRAGSTPTTSPRAGGSVPRARTQAGVRGPRVFGRATGPRSESDANLASRDEPVGAHAAGERGRRSPQSNGGLALNAKTTADVRGGLRASPRGPSWPPSPSASSPRGRMSRAHSVRPKPAKMLRAPGPVRASSPELSSTSASYSTGRRLPGVEAPRSRVANLHTRTTGAGFRERLFAR
jgi:hypothetical protein